MTDPEAEIARLRRLLRADPGSLQFVPLADALRRAGRLEEARDVLDAGRERHPTLKGAAVLAARVYVALGEAEPALRILDELAPQDPTNLELGLLHLELLDEVDRVEDARGVLARLGEVAPDDARLRPWRVRLLDDGGPGGAGEPAALEAGARDPFVTPALAERLQAAGRRAAALRVWRQLAQEDPGDETFAARVTALEGATDERPRPATPPLEVVEWADRRARPAPPRSALVRWLALFRRSD